MRYFVGNEPDRGTYTLDATSKPKGMTITGTEGPNNGKTFPAIYELEGDTLRICYDLSGAKRPTKFATVAGTKLKYTRDIQSQEGIGDLRWTKCLTNRFRLRCASVFAALRRDKGVHREVQKNMVRGMFVGGMGEGATGSEGQFRSESFRDVGY